MTIAVHLVAEGITRGRLPSRGDAQDLAAQGLRVMCEAGVPTLARADVELAIGTEGQPPAVVPTTLGDATEDDGWLAEVLPVPAHRREPVVVLGRVVSEYRLLILGGSQPEQAALTRRAGVVHGQQRCGHPTVDKVENPARVAFADQRAAIGERDQAPGRGQATGHLTHRRRARCGAATGTGVRRRACRGAAAGTGLRRRTCRGAAAGTGVRAGLTGGGSAARQNDKKGGDAEASTWGGPSAAQHGVSVSARPKCRRNVLDFRSAGRWWRTFRSPPAHRPA